MNSNFELFNHYSSGWITVFNYLESYGDLLLFDEHDGYGTFCTKLEFVFELPFELTICKGNYKA